MNYQLFGQTGLNVSQIALGTRNLGTGYDEIIYKVS